MTFFSLMFSISQNTWGQEKLPEASEIHVYAASSLADVLQVSRKKFNTFSKDRLVFNFGASNMLALQIQQGAPADLFLSADEEKMDALEKNHCVLKTSRQSFLSNTLVIVVPSQNFVKWHSPKDLLSPSVKKIAMAEPWSVPAGIYARKYFETLGIWNALQTKIIPTENVRATLATVASGNVDAGIVYKTDARLLKKIKISYEVPREDGPKISYPFAVMLHGKNPKGALMYLHYLTSREGRQLFEAYGFLVTESLA
jgi:molybdate transport system substrate-binding protein